MPAKVISRLRSQRPGSTPRISLIPMISSKGRNSPTAGPQRVSKMSDTQAPMPPIQFATGPPALVFSEGSLW